MESSTEVEDRGLILLKEIDPVPPGPVLDSSAFLLSRSISRRRSERERLTLGIFVGNCEVILSDVQPRELEKEKSEA